MKIQKSALKGFGDNLNTPGLKSKSPGRKEKSPGPQVLFKKKKARKTVMLTQVDIFMD